jgi:hypothetical protein
MASSDWGKIPGLPLVSPLFVTAVSLLVKFFPRQQRVSHLKAGKIVDDPQWKCIAKRVYKFRFKISKNIPRISFT